MRKLLIAFIAVSLLVVIPLMSAERSQEAYLDARAKAWDAYNDGYFGVAEGLFREAAALTPFKWVEAWQLLNVANCIIKNAHKDKNNNPSQDVAERALKVLEKARNLAEKNPPSKEYRSALPDIEQMILYCERVIGRKPWPTD